MKEKKANENNKVHIHGYINNVKKVELENKKVAFYIDVATKESYKDEKEEWKNKFSFHTVNVNTDDKKAIKALNAIAADIAKNIENKDNKEYKAKNHEASFDGMLITRKNTKDGVDYYNQVIVSTVEDMELDVKKEDKEVRNTASFKGNIANIDVKDGFAVIMIGTHYYAPGKVEGGEPVKLENGTELTRMTSYVETRLSEGYKSDLFKAIKEGEIGVGDLVSVRGQMHNNNFEDKEGVKRYKVVVDLNNIEVVHKKGEKKAETEEKKKEKKTQRSM